MMSTRKHLSQLDIQSSSGQIQLILGPMFSGKTTELLRRMKRYQIADYSCLIIKYAKDDRYEQEQISTHDKQMLPAIATEKLSTLAKTAEAYEVIGIDEGQFFPDVVSFCDNLAEIGKVVIVSALDGTFQKKGFGDFLNLIPLAESVIKLTAVCMNCCKEASYTKRIGLETKVEVIGGADKYLAVCRQCYKSPVNRSPRKKSATPSHMPLSERNLNIQVPKRQLIYSPDAMHA